MPIRKVAYVVTGAALALALGTVGGLVAAGAQVADPTPTTLAAGNNYEVCPDGNADWSVTPATNLGAGVLNVVCPTTTSTPPTTAPPTTAPPTTAPPTTAPPTTAPPTTPPTTAPPTTAPPTTAAPTTTTTVPPPPALWKPPHLFEWQWLLTGALNTSNATQMGTGVTAWDGTKPPATNPTVYDIDGIINPKSTVTTLHNMGFKAVCYIEVGTAGSYYTAAQEGQPVTYYQQFANAGVLGNGLPGYPKEKFLNINAPATTRILESMISQQCAAKGFDAVETDLDTTFDNLEGKTGFTITRANEETFLSGLARYMNSVGEVWFSKNLTTTGSTAFIKAMQPFAAGTLEEQPNEYNDLGLIQPFIDAKKPVMDVEFNVAQSKYCPIDIGKKVIGTTFPVALSGKRTPCDL